MTTLRNNLITDFSFSSYFSDPILGYRVFAYESLVNPANPMPYVDMRSEAGYTFGWSIRSIDDIGDYNGDGLDDILYERQFVDLPPLVLISNGDGTFSESMPIVGDASRETIGEAFSADFNGDGLLDIYGTVNGEIEHWPGIPEGSKGASGGDLLLLNNGNTSFEAIKVTSLVEHQLGIELQYQHGGHFGDLDNDGDMDVISMEFNDRVGPDEGIAIEKRVLLNDGSGNFTFSDTTLPAVISSYSGNPSVRIADLDNDGIVDYVIPTNFWGTPAQLLESQAGTQVFFNNGNTQFNDDELFVINDHWIVDKVDQLSAQYPAADLSVMGLQPNFYNFFDINDDGYLDILSSQKLQAEGVEGTAGGFQLYMNNGDRTFTERTEEYFPNLERNYTLYGDVTPDITRFNFADIDGDGDNDFVMEQGHNLIFNDSGVKSTIYPYIMINEAGKFYPIALDAVPELINSNESVAYGNMITGDFNGDGIIDIVSIGGADSNGNLASDSNSPNDGVWVHFGKAGTAALSSSIRGTGLSDSITGTSSNDRLIPGMGNDYLDGGEGIDTALYWSAASDFTISRSNDAVIVTHLDQNDHLYNTERIKFIDTFVAVDFNKGQSAYNAATLIGTAFGSEYISEYFDIGLSLFDQGNSVREIAQLISDSRLIENIVGGSNSSWVAHVYENVVGRGPSYKDLALYTGYLEQGTHSKTDLLVLAQSVGLIEQQIELSVLQASGLTYDPII